MDNTQVTAHDRSWFLFADWQGMTRISLPGDRVKTDANLDRPHENNPLVLRPDGRVWSSYALDIDPVTLKKLKQDPPGHDSPDPLGGPEIRLEYAGEIATIRGVKHRLIASGEALQLGGAPGRRESAGRVRYNIYPDHALVAFGYAAAQTQVGLVLRTADGAGHVAWCLPTALTPNSSPDAFRSPGSTWIADRDLAEDLAYLVEVRDDGTVVSEARTPAVAGPWVFDGQVWWQPDDATLCAGPSLGEVAQAFKLSPEHAGPGRLLRLSGRKLLLPWHRASILDLAPAKPGKGELSRKHKAVEAPMYHEAERLLRPIRAGMAKQLRQHLRRADQRAGPARPDRHARRGRHLSGRRRPLSGLAQKDRGPAQRAAPADARGRRAAVDPRPQPVARRRRARGPRTTASKSRSLTIAPGVVRRH